MAFIIGMGIKSVFFSNNISPVSQQPLLVTTLLLLLLIFIARYLIAMYCQEQWSASLELKLLASERLVMTDSLTSLANKRACTKRMEDEIARAKCYNLPLAIIYADIDFFKLINDVHGHAIGDLAICAVGKCLQKNVRSTDMVARLGGEEFVIILSETTLGQATLLANRLRKIIEVFRIPLSNGTRLQMTVSLGVSAYPETSDNSIHMLQDADDAMSRAKEAGRNRVFEAKATQRLFVLENAG
jgi:diguanylate cyclase (GGDEF)-like protein